MILKKPYAFLIKHFRLINLIITALTGFITYKSYQIVSFFNSYVNNNYSGTFYSGFYQEYVSSLIIFILVLIIIGVAAICLLFAYKNKKIKSYFFSLYYYIVLLVAFIVVRNLMVGMEEKLLSAEVARICRDISILAISLQIPLVIIFLINAFGFNLGKYNFKDDLKELEISEQDNEEVEITLNRDTTKLKRTFRRFKREFAYYLKENKYFFILIVVLAIGAIGYMIYKSSNNVVDRVYSQSDAFNMNNLTYKVEDSIITNLNYNGDIIEKDKYYLVVKMYIENNNQDDATIDYKNFRLELGKDKYAYPDLGKGDYFIDYAKNVYVSNVNANTKNTYALIFEINNNDLKNKYRLKVSNGVAAVENNVVGRFNYVVLTPVIIDKVSLEGTFKQNNEISFVNSNLGKSTLTVSNATFTDKYIYDYQKCSNNNCLNYKDMLVISYAQKNKTILVMDYSFKIDETIPFYNKSHNISKFINNFVKIKYKKNDIEKYSNVENITPENMNGKFALEISKDIVDADEIYLAIIIRNKEYLVDIKN